MLSTKYMIGGDITLGDGRGKVSIYGTTFETENFDLKHERPFLLSLYNGIERD